MNHKRRAAARKIPPFAETHAVKKKKTVDFCRDKGKQASAGQLRGVERDGPGSTPSIVQLAGDFFAHAAAPLEDGRLKVCPGLGPAVVDNAESVDPEQHLEA